MPRYSVFLLDKALANGPGVCFTRASRTQHRKEHVEELPNDLTVTLHKAKAAVGTVRACLKPIEIF